MTLRELLEYVNDGQRVRVTHKQDDGYGNVVTTMSAKLFRETYNEHFLDAKIKNIGAEPEYVGGDSVITISI